MNMNLSSSPASPIVVMFMFGFWIATLAVYVAFAIGVAIEARRLKQNGGQTVFVDYPIWTLATLLAGPLVATAYWILHHSALRVGQPSSTIAG